MIGTEDYETSVEIVGDELVSCSCNCPYDGGICKHVDALLFAIEDVTNDIEHFNKFNYTKIEDKNFHKVFQGASRQVFSLCKDDFQKISK